MVNKRAGGIYGLGEAAEAMAAGMYFDPVLDQV